MQPGQPTRLSRCAPQALHGWLHALHAARRSAFHPSQCLLQQTPPTCTGAPVCAWLAQRILLLLVPPPPLLLLLRVAQRSSGNVVVFLGNEGPLGVPQQPIVFENARRLNALVVLVEHRYYGRHHDSI